MNVSIQLSILCHDLPWHSFQCRKLLFHFQWANIKIQITYLPYLAHKHKHKYSHTHTHIQWPFYSEDAHDNAFCERKLKFAIAYNYADVNEY